MSETTKANAVAFHKKAVFEGDVENAFRMYAGAVCRRHNPLIEDGMEGLAHRPDQGQSSRRAWRDQARQS